MLLLYDILVGVKNECSAGSGVVSSNSNMASFTTKTTVSDNDLVSAIDRIDVGSRKEGLFRVRDETISNFDLESHVRDYFLKHVELVRRNEYEPTKRDSFLSAVRHFERYLVERLRPNINRVVVDDDSTGLAIMPWCYVCPKPTTAELERWMKNWDDDGKLYTWANMVTRSEYPTLTVKYSPHCIYLKDFKMVMLCVVVLVSK